MQAIVVDANSPYAEISDAAEWHFYAKQSDYCLADCAALAASLAAAGDFLPDLPQDLAEHVVQLLKKPKLRSETHAVFAKIAASYARMNIRHTDLFSALAKRAKPFSDLDIKSMVDLLWAYAFVDQPAEVLFDLAARKVSVSWKSMLSSDVMITAWAFSSRRVNDKRVYDAVSNHLQHYGPCYSTHELSRLVWAFATQKVEDPALFRTVADLAASQADAFSPQDLADLLWGYAVMQFPDPGLFKAAEKHALERLHEYKPENLSNLVWGFAAAGP
eukprot:scaffold503446_cov44-Prasinocladus_malaysianus.AAC.1